MERIVWHNGLTKPESQACVSIYDSAMMRGDSCFEMMRTFNLKTFKLDWHMSRLMDSCRILDIPVWNPQEIYDAHEELLQWHIENFKEEQEWRTLINISRGTLPLYQEMLGGEGTNVMIACFPLRYILKDKYHLYRDGVHAIVSSQRAIPFHLLDARLKTRSRQHYQMADLDVARQDKDAWALLLSPDGYVAEFSGSNIAIVKHGMILTPRTNCLHGISMGFTASLATGYFQMADITQFDIETADECFATCTPYSIIPVTRINGKPIGTGKPGKTTQYLQQEWIKAVGCDYIQQARTWSA